MRNALNNIDEKRLRNWVGNGQIVAEEIVDGALRTTDRIRRRLNPSPVRTILLTAGATAAAAGLAFVGYKAVKGFMSDDEELVDDIAETDDLETDGAERTERTARIH